MALSPACYRSFTWRASTGRWRWLMLGTLGVATTSCWGEVGKEEPGGERDQGATGATTGNPGSTTGGDPQVGNTPIGATTTGTTIPGASTTGERAPGSVCENATALGGGWERCENGLIHRAEPGQCASSLPRDARISEATLRIYYPDWDPSVSDRPENAACIRDSDCTAQPLGYCEIGNGDWINGTYCNYGCKTDAECGEGTVCLCGEPVGHCVSSQCKSDADCPQGMCASYTSSPGCPSQAFACQTVRDECVTSNDCSGLTCTVDEYSDGPKYRHCSPDTWVCGRPFLIEGAARSAECATRDDWYPAGHAAAAPMELDAELRALVAQGWLEQALMEHASVAAFARFSLQLLSLGAPAELVSDSAQAMADEIVHARDCFALARRHSERDVGPAPLPLTGALEELDLTSIVLGTIAEGCIGETVAALEAAEAQAHCQDEAVRAVLARISADETKHAQLAWRFVAWALQRGSASLRREVRTAFERELGAAPAHSSGGLELSATEQRLLQQGLVGPELRRALRARVLHDIVAPCARALLDEPARRSEPTLTLTLASV